MSSNSPGDPGRFAAWWWCSASALFLVALLAACQHAVPRQGWSKRWGPMVPHHEFPGDCGICHLPQDWKTLRPDFSFDHEAVTGYTLNGAHEDAQCLRCHNDRGPVTVYLERGCGGCHVDPHQSQLGLDCERCHTEDSWQAIGAVVDHARTRFPLVAAHAVTPCESCHVRSRVGQYAGAPAECHLCHQRDAQLAQPNHQINGWAVGCERCHTQSNWDAVGFVHTPTFPLDGAHTAVTCQQCHPGGLAVPINSDCVACHLPDYTSTTNPNHIASGFSTDCNDCHNTVAWDN